MSVLRFARMGRHCFRLSSLPFGLASVRRRARALCRSPVGYALGSIGRSAIPLEHCAHCGARATCFPSEASLDLDEQSSTPPALIVPYCATCFREYSAHDTRFLGATLASLLSALTLVVVLPLSSGAINLPNMLLLVALAASWPLLFVFLLSRYRVASRGPSRAAFWSIGQGLTVTRRSFARACARARAAKSGEAAQRIRVVFVKHRPLKPWHLTGLVVGLLSAPVSFAYYHPTLRVLNLSGARLVVVVDGKDLVTLEPTSSESPLAGTELHLAAGDHEILATRVGGVVVDSRRQRFMAGASYLYAPLSDGYCFWIERANYGRADPVPEREPLQADAWLWLLPEPLDLWFTSAGGSNVRSRLSGGTIAALRQGRCGETTGAARDAK